MQPHNQIKVTTLPHYVPRRWMRCFSNRPNVVGSEPYAAMINGKPYDVAQVAQFGVKSPVAMVLIEGATLTPGEFPDKALPFFDPGAAHLLGYCMLDQLLTWAHQECSACDGCGFAEPPPGHLVEDETGDMLCRECLGTGRTRYAPGRLFGSLINRHLVFNLLSRLHTRYDVSVSRVGQAITQFAGDGWKVLIADLSPRAGKEKDLEAEILEFPYK